MKRRHGVGHAAAGAGPIIIRSGLRLTGKLIGGATRNPRRRMHGHTYARRARVIYICHLLSTVVHAVSRPAHS
jgi:hypothetical protein